MKILFILLLAFSNTSQANSEKKKIFDRIMTAAQCVVEDYGCNLTVSGVDSRDESQDASKLLRSLLYRGGFNYNAGPSPKDGNFTFVALCLSSSGEGCTGLGARAKIHLYDHFYSDSLNDLFRATVLLHEVGHAVGITHSKFEDSEEWNRVIMDNCFTPSLRRNCGL